MKFDGALIKEQGVSFAIVVVKSSVLNSSSESERAQNSFRPYFPGVPIILMAQNTQGIPTYYGRPDIVKFLSNVNPARTPWKTYLSS